MKPTIRQMISAALLAGILGTNSVKATPASFTGSYTNNFNSLGTSGTTMPAGFRPLIISGANTTYTVASPITTTAIAAATASGTTTTLATWATGASVTSSGTGLFNCGSVGNNADRALGSDPTGIAAMVIELSLSNNTGGSLSGVTFIYDAKCLTNGTSGNGMESAELPGYSFFYSLTGGTTAAEWSKVSALSLPNYLQGTTSNSGVATITFASPLTNNGIMYFRWADDNCQTISPDQMIAIDNIGIAGISAAGPTVSITSPANNANFLPGTNISITASASESGGTITNVSFYYNSSNKLGNVTNSPYSLTWSNISIGSYALTAVATDGSGISSTSAVVTVSVSHSAPIISLTSPANGASFAAPASILLSATATGTDGAVTNVGFYQGSTLLANLPAAPYTYAWSNVPSGSYSLTARATDNNGISATSSVVSVSVTNPAVASFTGAYYQDFDLALSNSTTSMPSGFSAFGLASDHFTFTNGTPITTNAIAAPTAGVAALTVWNAGAAVARAGSTLFNIGCWDSLNNRALGTDPTGNGATVIQLAISNNTGGNLPGVIFSYAERCLTNGSTSNGSYTDDGTERLELPGYSFFYSIVGDNNASNWFYVQALSLTNWVQGTSSNSGNVSISFPSPLTNNGIMYFRWADDNCVASSPDQMYAIDNISIVPSVTTNQFFAGYFSGLGLTSGFNMILTNAAGTNFYVWSSTNPLAPAATWTLVSAMGEQPLNNGLGQSRYAINLNPVISPTYYLIGHTNAGPYAPTAPVEWATVQNGDDYDFFSITYGMNPDGVLQLPAPVVSITAPTNGEILASGSSPVLSADASDTNATITSVAFYAGSTLIDIATNSPYTVTMTNPADGNYMLTAVVLDSLNISATSAPVTITVGIPNVPPTVSITNPANNSAFTAPALISLGATAADSDGTVTNVAFYQGFGLLTNLTSAPYIYNWTGVSAGTYTLFAVATDNKGASTTSSVVTLTVTNLPSPSPLQQIKTVFVIAMENHNWSQIYGNSAAPFINGLVTPGNTNAAQVSFATQYYNAGNGVHPSEPNYVWAEAGTDFGVHTDADPAGGNTFTAPHLTAQLNTAGIPWKNYQEDLQYSSSAAVSAGGSGSVNPYNGSTTVGYAVKHNPMAFFTDTQTQNVYPLTNLLADLTNNSVGRYNWITPDLANDMHDGLSGFSYHGTSYSGDQAAVAEGDNFLSIIIPKIMASSSYKSNGVIVIWWDESEGGDTTAQAIGEIIISPLAKGNAYNSALVYSHSSDLKTMEEIFGLNYLSNSIPSGETAATGGYNNVATVNDLSDMFLGLPLINVQQPAGLSLTNGSSTLAFGSAGVGTNVTKTFIVANTGAAALTVSGIGITGTNSSDFAISGISLPASIPAGSSTTFTVTFAPVAGGSRSGSLLLTNNVSGQSPFTIGLTGQGTLVTPSGLSVRKSPSGGFALSFIVGPGQPYRVLASSDIMAPLGSWTQVGSGFATSNPVIFLDTNSLASRFYQVVSP